MCRRAQWNARGSAGQLAAVSEDASSGRPQAKKCHGEYRLAVRQILVRVQLWLGTSGRWSSCGPRRKAADTTTVLGMAGMALHLNSVVPGSVAVLSTMLRHPHERCED
jgi:hypothetical protein